MMPLLHPFFLIVHSKFPTPPEARTWIKHHPGYTIDLIPDSEEGWTQQTSLIDSMEKYPGPYAGYLHTNDDILLDLHLLSTLNTSKFWVCSCLANEKLPTCSAASWKVPCPHMNLWWKTERPHNKKDYARKFFALLRPEEKELLAYNMRHYDYPEYSLCGSASDFTYVPWHMRDPYLSLAKRIQPVTLKFAMFLPTLPRLLVRDDELILTDGVYLHGSKRSNWREGVKAMTSTGAPFVHPIKILLIKDAQQQLARWWKLDE